MTKHKQPALNWNSHTNTIEETRHRKTTLTDFLLGRRANENRVTVCELLSFIYLEEFYNKIL